MKTALVCIAKDEDNYIDEWIRYYKKLGFDAIFLYENKWRSSVEYDYVFKIPYDGDIIQSQAYNHFIQNYYTEYKWAAFFDIDEYLVLKKHNNIKEFLLEYNDYDAVGINWVFFGDNNLNEPNGEFSLLKRFTKRQIGVNQMIKTIVKMNPSTIISIHEVINKLWVDPTYKRFHQSSLFPNGDDETAQLNHYFCKTKPEFQHKINRGVAWPNNGYRQWHEYEPHNLNDIEDLCAYNFMYGN